MSKTVYCLSCGQTFISTSSADCSLCGAVGKLIDPEAPEALRDLQLRKQQPISNLPQSRAEWVASIIDTCLIQPFSVLSVLGGLTFLFMLVLFWYLEMLPSNPDQANGVEITIVAVVLVMSALIAFRCFLLWMTWKKVVAENARRQS